MGIGMNEWEEKVFNELVSRGYTTEWAKHCASFAGSLYTKRFNEVSEVMNVITKTIGLHE